MQIVLAGTVPLGDACRTLLTLAVSDTAIGFTPEQCAGLLQPFAQAKRSSPWRPMSSRTSCGSSRFHQSARRRTPVCAADAEVLFAERVEQQLTLCCVMLYDDVRR